MRSCLLYSYNVKNRQTDCGMRRESAAVDLERQRDDVGWPRCAQGGFNLRRMDVRDN